MKVGVWPFFTASCHTLGRRGAIDGALVNGPMRWWGGGFDTRSHVHTHIYVYVHIYNNALIYVYIYIIMHTYMYIYTHTYVYIYIHNNAQTDKPLP